MTIRPTDTDRYGRTVAEVILPDGKSLNRELVGLGIAWWYSKYAPTDRELERLEAGAKAAKLGLWCQANPVAPWDGTDHRYGTDDRLGTDSEGAANGDAFKAVGQSLFVLLAGQVGMVVSRRMFVQRSRSCTIRPGW